MDMEGDFKKYLEDLYSTDPVPRDSLNDECEILVVGAGFGGCLWLFRVPAAKDNQRQPKTTKR